MVHDGGPLEAPIFTFCPHVLSDPERAALQLHRHALVTHPPSKGVRSSRF